LRVTKYLISFPGDAMDHIPEEEQPAVSDAAHAVVQEAKDAGVFVFAGGVDEDAPPVLVAGDGTVTPVSNPGPKDFGGYTLLDVPSREETLEWVAKIASACRCPQEVREFMYDPLV
jgi:hypothetical protein